MTGAAQDAPSTASSLPNCRHNATTPQSACGANGWSDTSVASALQLLSKALKSNRDGMLRQGQVGGQGAVDRVAPRPVMGSAVPTPPPAVVSFTAVQSERDDVRRNRQVVEQGAAQAPAPPPAVVVSTALKSNRDGMLRQGQALIRVRLSAVGPRPGMGSAVWPQLPEMGHFRAAWEGARLVGQRQSR